MKYSTMWRRCLQVHLERIYKLHSSDVTVSSKGKREEIGEIVPFDTIWSRLPSIPNKHELLRACLVGVTEYIRRLTAGGYGAALL